MSNHYVDHVNGNNQTIDIRDTECRGQLTNLAQSIANALGANNGIATLDNNGKVPSSQLDLTDKADKVSSATNGNLAGLNGSGNLTDSGWNGAKDTTSISGNPISISGLKANQLAINPIITFEPIRDLHGQSKPYPAGGGKNKLPMTVQSIKDANTSGTWSGNAYTLNNVTFTILADSADNVTGINVYSSQGASSTTAFFVTKNYTNADSLILNGCPSGGATNTYRLDAGTDATSDIGSGKSISGGLSNVNIRIVIFSGVTMSNKVFYPMIRLATETDSSFAPYENICPISGYDKIEVLSCGKNLFDGTYSKTAYYLNDSGVETSSAAFNISQYIRVKASASYYFSNLNPGSSSACICWYNNAKEFISARRINEGFTDNSPANACYVRASVSISATNVCINEGNTAITYVPPVKATSISESLGQTVYGGSLDLRSGKFTVTHKMVDMGTLDYSYHATSSGVKIYVTTSLSDMLQTAGTHPFICECYDSVQTRGVDFTISRYNQYAENANLYVNDSRYSADAEGAAALKVALSGVKLVYQLATPFTIQLTPHEISLLKDYAYVSTNGTSIALDYHNGELASLADVSQLGETLNKLSNVNNNKAGDGVSLLSYTSSSNYFTIPMDGYIYASSGSSTSGKLRVVIRGSNNRNIAFIYMNVTNDNQIQSLFVKKGMRAYIQENGTSGDVVFTPLIP